MMTSTMLSTLHAVWGQSSGETLVFPTQGSDFAPAIDWLFYAITAISAFFFAIIVGVMVYFVLRYRRRPGHDAQPSASHNTPLEIAWSVLPGFILLAIFAAGFLIFLDLRRVPEGAYEIKVTARKWSWAFEYPNGLVMEDLHVPADRPVRLLMSSMDVIHSLFVPAFRVKQDLVPGRYTEMWFRATGAGTHRLYCAEYCGQKHSTMVANVVVHEPADFEQWLRIETDKTNNLPPAELGALLYKRQGCAQCHAIDDNVQGKAGPSFAKTFGTQQRLTNGESVTIEENYLRRSILEPLAQIRAGFQPVMPTYQGRLRDNEIDALIAYIKSLNPEATPKE
ncbi:MULTISPECIES: cytochrome c oxidase subunit II [unclassified Schlesneria]|uniref:cytochrome c oxidase subunit II n=1 Tax=Schlesneria TaxID=656899 RepID=UPI0035A078BC